MKRNPTTNNLIVEIADGSAGSATPGADAESNDSRGVKVSSWLMGFNGTTWDRLRTGIIAVTATLTGFLNTLPWAVYSASPTVRTNGQGGPLQSNVNGALHVVEQDAPVYENNTTGKAVVEENYTNATVTADGQVKASGGFIRSITLSATGAVTAGLITIYDNTAESGTVIWSGIVQVAANPITIFLNVSTATGIYIGYDGTVANVRTQMSYR